MHTRRRSALLDAARRRWLPSVAVAAALLLLSLYGLHVARLGPANFGKEDFGSNYTAATIIRDGGAHQVYDLGLQRAVGDRILAPSRLTLPFDQVALGAVLLVPLTALPLADAFVVWTIGQFFLVVIAVVVAVRAAPAPRPRSILAGAAIAGVAGTTIALEVLVGVGQSTAVNALGLAMAYRCWRRGSYAWGGAWLVVTAALFKPHLALGLAAFLVGWGNRRVMLGAAGAAAAAGVALLALVGTGGVTAMLTNAARLSFSQRGGASFMALPSMWFNDGQMTLVIGIAGGCASLALCGYLGRRLRRDPSLLGPALATAAALSLLASPHAYIYDVVMLAPAVAWSLGELGLFTVRQPRSLNGSAWTIVVLWAVAPWVSPLFSVQLTPLVARIGVPIVWLTLVLTAALWSVPAETRGGLRRPALQPALPSG